MAPRLSGRALGAQSSRTAPAALMRWHHVDGADGRAMRHRAIVTGGSRGIGRAIVERLCADGAQVLTCGRGERPADLPADVRWVRADIAIPGQAEDVVRRAVSELGGISLLVNNAGVQVEKNVVASTDEDWDLVVNTNCRGVFAMCRAVLPHLAADGGVIINIGSISGNVSDPAMALYNASKAFVHSLTRSIAVDHGPMVRCNAVSPGWIATGMVDDAFAVATDPRAAQADGLARHPTGRLGTPQDVAGAVSWLASDEASWVTGQCITVDGGLTAASPLNPHLF
jgi:NAD(P)-dependent dehydrogenase (short-subunit alcohol dehydrogenase family)